MDASQSGDEDVQQLMFIQTGPDVPDPDGVDAAKAAEEDKKEKRNEEQKEAQKQTFWQQQQ